MTTHVTCCLPGRFIRDSVPQVFIGRVIMEAPSARHGLKFHSPRRQAGTNHIICWDIPGAVSHSYQISKFLDASQRPGKTIHLPHIFVIPSDSETGLFKFFLRISTYACYVHSFLHTIQYRQYNTPTDHFFLSMCAILHTSKACLFY